MSEKQRAEVWHAISKSAFDFASRRVTLKVKRVPEDCEYLILATQVEFEEFINALIEAPEPERR